jgi:hypothetical protein
MGVETIRGHDYLSLTTVIPGHANGVNPESRDSGFEAEFIIGRRKSADPLASPRNDKN